MTVSISKMNIEYYLNTTLTGDGEFKEVKDLTSYYLESGAPPGRWYGAGLAGLGLDVGQQVSRRHARKLFEELRDPITGRYLGRKIKVTQETPSGATTPMGKPAKDTREAVAGFDLTFSVPKSVSVFWAMADPATQGKIYAAHQAAMAQTLTWLEDNVIQSRSGHGGVAHVDVKGLIATGFDHWESRAGDPQLHTHMVISNRVQRASDNQWVTLDSYTLHRHVVAASEMYNGLLFDEVARRTNAVAEQRDGTIHLDPTLNATTADGAAPADPITETEKEADSPANARIELEAVPDELIWMFSSRTRAIYEETENLIAAYVNEHGHRPSETEILDLRRQAVLATRQKKDPEYMPLSVRMSKWKLQALEAGFNPLDITATALVGEPILIHPDKVPEETIGRISSFVLDQAARSRPTFTRANLSAATSRLLATVRCQSPEARQALTDRVVTAALHQAVKLTPTRFGVPAEAQAGLTRNGHSVLDQPESWLYSTQATLDTEAYLQDAATNQAAPHLVDSEDLTELLETTQVDDDGHTLARDQARAAHAALTSASRVSAIIGPAGTGKTTTMRGVRAAWVAEHGADSVVGLAPSAVAAAVLGEEVGMSTDNIAKWLYESVGDGAARRIKQLRQLEADLDAALARATDHPSPAADARVLAVQTRLSAAYTTHAKYQLKKDQLLIVDEASMASTTDLAQLIGQAEQAGAKVLLIGDPAQLEAVEAGGYLGWLERSKTASMLSSVWRFKNKWEADASLRLRTSTDRDEDNDTLRIYAEHERITCCEAGKASEAAYRTWLTTTLTPEAGSTILIGATNEDVNDLNTRAQADLIEVGRVTVDPHAHATLRNEAAAHVGDRLLARKNNRALTDENGDFVKNGTRLTIETIRDDGSVTARREDTNTTVALPSDYLAESVELGYAVTAHRAQGVTVDHGYTIARAGLGRELLYVAMTRGKSDNQVFVEIPDQPEHTPDPWGIYKQVQADHGMKVLAGILANTTAVHLAQEVRLAEYGKAHDLTRYVSEYEYVADVIRTRQLTDWLTTTYTPEAVTQLQNDEAWPDLARTFPGPDRLTNAPATELSDVKGLQRLFETRRPTGTKLFENLLPRVHSETPEESRLAGELETHIREELDRLAAEPAINKHEAEHSEQEHRLTVLYRAMTNQDDQSVAVTAPPKSERRLRDLYRRYTTAMEHEHYGDWYDEHHDNAYEPALDDTELEIALGHPLPDEHSDYAYQPTTAETAGQSNPGRA